MACVPSEDSDQPGPELYSGVSESSLGAHAILLVCHALAEISEISFLYCSEKKNVLVFHFISL